MAKNLTGLGATIFALLFLFACSRPQQSPPDTITTAISNSVANLNPIFSTDGNNQHINELIHGALLRVGADLLPEGDLVESFTVPNETTINFALRKNCKFHNGRAVTAQDVKKSWEIFVDEKNHSPFRESLLRIKKIEIVDDFHFSFHTDGPSPSLLTDLAIMKIIPAEESSLGAGPFKLVSLSPRQIILQRFPDSCIGPKPKFERLVIKTVRDDLARLLKLRTGELDYLSDELNYRKVERVLNHEEPLLAAAVTEGVSYNYLGVNVIEPKLQDARVRQALAYSFDLGALTKYQGRDMQAPAKNILSDQNRYANTNLALYEHNPEKARRLLDQAGYFNGSNHKPVLRLQLLTANNQFAIDNARVLVTQAHQVGIELAQKAYEWGTFFADIKSKHTQLYLMRWLGATDPSIYAQAFSSGKIGRSNRTNYKNPKLEQLLEKGESTMNFNKRRQIYGEVQSILHEELPYINLWHNKNSAVFRKEVKGVTLFANGSWRNLLSLYKEK